MGNNDDHGDQQTPYLHDPAKRQRISDQLTYDIDLTRSINARLEWCLKADMESLVDRLDIDAIEKKGKDMKALIRSMRLPAVTRYICLFIGKRETDEFLRMLAESIQYKDVETVLYYAPQALWPQAFLVKAMTAAMHPNISEAYVARYLGLFEYIGFLKRSPCIAGPKNTLVVSALPALFSVVDQIVGCGPTRQRKLRDHPMLRQF